MPKKGIKVELSVYLLKIARDGSKNNYVSRNFLSDYIQIIPNFTSKEVKKDLFFSCSASIT